METGVFSMWSMPRSYVEVNWGDPVNSVDSSDVGYSLDCNDVSTEAEESPFLRAVSKQRLVKTLQAGQDLECSDL
jgi:hypothetical protein